ncbi:hypothetical protein GC197_11010 [bacterium]|nr:hypothetical protein [bacterium]
MESPAEDQVPSSDGTMRNGTPDTWEGDSVEFTSRAARSASQPVSKRWVRLPLILFLATCASTFFVGMTRWEPAEAILNVIAWSNAPEMGLPRAYDPYLSSPPVEMRRDLISYAGAWQTGFLYMLTMLGILVAHEMGHFVMALRYRVPASFPYFIPVPISPIGTFGAVIGMQGMRADRKQLFDIGLAGPLAGLIVAIPVLWYGIRQMDLTTPGTGDFQLDLPIAVSWMMQWMQVPGYEPGDYINQSQLNPYFMAGWVGLLVTGLNMVPVSQLDGGHVSYTLFGKNAHVIARAFVVFAAVFIVWMGAYNWILMLILVIMMRPDHPATSDDTVPIGWFRYTLGSASLAIPLLCFPPMAIVPA